MNKELMQQALDALVKIPTVTHGVLVRLSDVEHVFLAAIAQPVQPLTHEQRFDLLTAFEEHKHEWHAHAILIDMVEAKLNEKNHG